jgi:threonine aldolase
MKISIASDNVSPVHPDILKALFEANDGWAASYGNDPWTLEAIKVLQDTFKTAGKVFIVPTGTGGNIFALKIACRPYSSILCSSISHINCQESGAPEANIGCKLILVAATDGKVTPSAVKKQLTHERLSGKHSTLPKILSLTQPTEVGTVYSIEELKALSQLCKEEGLLLHIDGSRLYNAAVALEVPLSAITEAAKPDILSLGGTKNGLMSAEAVLIFNPLLDEGSDHLQKQTLQLMSKMRYLSAQFLPFFRNELWKKLAQNANDKAKKLAGYLEAVPGLKLNYPVQTNQIFFSAPPETIPFILENIGCILWNPDIHEIRFVTSWNTTDEEIEQVKQILADRKL